ncbi:Sulfotransferase family protein [Sinosporangium album]|uniref:Sulfotransferase family protein n=1 Tax=Sinosporangium album TaxID=504805 RepID=A0A1G8AIG6_9ACTN|nr:sulfotransferase [Sinosporangium album]SDH20738.1 Sulfotransferase family protein [Sinosporangium album]
MNAPILVTGLPRSGTSWTGKMLAAGGEVVYVNEPLNPQHPPGLCPGVLKAEVTHRFQYISPDQDETWLPAFQDTVALKYHLLPELRRNHSLYDLARTARYGTAFTLGRLAGRRALLDDPFAVLSAGWFAERLGCRVILLTRDPVSLVGSWWRLGWTVHFRELLEQPLLLRDHPEVHGVWSLIDEQDRLVKIAALWRLADTLAARLAARHPGILRVRYEDLAADPVNAFRRLYDWCGLTWSPAAERRVRRACTGSASHRERRGFAWSGLSRTAYRPMDSRQALTTYADRLTPEEIARVRALTGAEPRV